MYLLGGKKDVVLFGTLRIWAENGYVCIEDSKCIGGKEGGFTQLLPRKALLHLKGICDMLGRSTDKDVVKYSDEWDRHMRFVEQVQDVIRKAQEQGSHDDPSMVKDRVRRRKTSVSVPSSSRDIPL